MLNVQDLERRWLKYKVKSKAKLIISILGSVLILIAASIYLLSDKEPTQKEPSPVISENKSIEKVQVLETPVETIETAAESEVAYIHQIEQQQAPSSLVLKPSLRFMDNIEDDIAPYLEEDATPKALKKSIPQPKAVVNDNTAVEKKVSLPVQSTNTQTLVTRSIKQDNSDLKDVIKRFKKNKNPILGLFIAKRYYDAEEYQKSYNYALITNEIDKNIEESWIIFSKSLVKLGQKQLAINTLQSYLKTTKSTKATTLLQTIQSGEFK